MTTVTHKNFQYVYPQLEEHMRNADFIAVDAEFTGINSLQYLKDSLFDTMEERYKKLRENIQPFIIVQFGITSFHRIPQTNRYRTHCYTFYLLPRSIPSKNRTFLWQITALEFLSNHHFDFNKIAYDGISYLNEPDEALFKEQVGNKELLHNLERFISYSEEDDINEHSNKIAKWLSENPSSKQTIIIKTLTPIVQYMIHKEVRRRFQDVWTVSGEQSVIVMKVPQTLRSTLEEKEGSILENVLLEAHIGFSRVFKLLVSLQKPIVGHNAYLDLMFMYQQFYNPLPKKYADFKTNLHRLFPIVYDTKHLSFQLQDLMEKQLKWKTNSLSELFAYFTDGKGKCLITNTPSVENEQNISEDFHNAGWDSYVTGYIFINMAYIFSSKKFGDSFTPRVVTNTEINNSIKEYRNCLNVIRGNISYLRLNGPDPESIRPRWLYVKSLQSKVLDTRQIAETFSPFGTVDVMPFSRNRALVAVANHRSAREILQHFRSHKDLYVVPYNPLRHSHSTRLFLWGGIVLSGGMFVWMIHHTFRKSV